MEIVICILLAYVLSGVSRVTKDLGKNVINRPIWAMNPTLDKIILAAISWPIRPIIEASQSSGQLARSVAFGLLAVLLQMLTFTVYIWCSYTIACLVFENFTLRIALSTVVVFVGSFFILPLMTFIMAPISLLLAWPLALLFPRKNNSPAKKTDAMLDNQS